MPNQIRPLRPRVHDLPPLPDPVARPNMRPARRVLRPADPTYRPVYASSQPGAAARAWSLTAAAMIPLIAIPLVVLLEAGPLLGFLTLAGILAVPTLLGAALVEAVRAGTPPGRRSA